MVPQLGLPCDKLRVDWGYFISMAKQGKGQMNKCSLCPSLAGSMLGSDFIASSCWLSQSPVQLFWNWSWSLCINTDPDFRRKLTSPLSCCSEHFAPSLALPAEPCSHHQQKGREKPKAAPLLNRVENFEREKKTQNLSLKVISALRYCLGCYCNIEMSKYSLSCCPEITFQWCPPIRCYSRALSVALYIKIASLSSLSLGWKEQLIKMQLFHYFGQGVEKNWRTTREIQMGRTWCEELL